LTTNVPKHPGNKKGKEQNSSFKGATDNKSPGMGPSHMNTNPKKRRIDKSGHLGEPRHSSITRGPQENGKHNIPTTQHETNEMKSKGGLSNTVTSKHNTVTGMPKNNNTHNEVVKTPSYDLEAYAGTQVMEEGNTQEEECVPESPINWEQT
jgi:hypothetical protein